jgi:hypothetical protein
MKNFLRLFRKSIKDKKFKRIFYVFRIIYRMDETLNELFPSINPNIDELNEMTPLNQDEQITNDDPEPETEVKEDFKESDIFMKSGKKRLKSKLKEPTDTIVEEDIKPKRKYPHLAKARAKGAEVRKAKAEARRLKKEEEKELKNKLKSEKREATAERNRQKAKARYYTEKEKKKSQPIAIQQQFIPKSTKKDMDFNTFASYMMKYENLKEQYKNKNIKMKPMKQVNTKPIKKEIPYNPPNYPLSHLYNPNLRNRKEWGM